MKEVVIGVPLAKFRPLRCRKANFVGVAYRLPARSALVFDAEPRSLEDTKGHGGVEAVWLD